MIHVNLFGEKKDNTPIYIFQLLIFGACILVSLVGCFFVQNEFSGRRADREADKAQLEQKLAKLKQKTKKVDELEVKKKLLADKLTTIANLKVKKQGPVHVMDELTKTVPTRAWLTSISQKDESIEFSGIAVDPQTVSEFMKNLGESVFFKGVELVYSRKSIKDSVRLQEFSVSANLTNAADLQKALQTRQGAAGAPAAAVNATAKPAAAAAPADAAAKPASS